jgi:hypothetical protein
MLCHGHELFLTYEKYFLSKTRVDESIWNDTQIQL